MTELKLEIKEQQPEGNIAPGIMITPPLDEDYWLLRVQLNEKGQAILGFPKFSTIGVGFAQEEDWNTNLPCTCPPAEIFEHIKHNKGDADINDADCLTAIEMVCEAGRKALGK